MQEQSVEDQIGVKNMKFFKRLFKKIGRAIKKVGKFFGKAFGKVFGAFKKLGPLGMMGLWIMMPTLASGWSTMLSKVVEGASTMGATSGSRIMQAVGRIVESSAKVLQTGTEKIGNVYKTVTNTIKGGLDAISGGSASRFENWLNKKRGQWGLKVNEDWQTNLENVAQEKTMSGGVITEGVVPTPRAETAQKLLEDAKLTGNKASFGEEGWWSETGKDRLKDATLSAGINTGFQVATAKYLEPVDEGGGGVVMGQLAGEPSSVAHNQMTDTIYQGYQNAGYNGMKDLNAMANSGFYGPGSPEWLAFMQQPIELPKRTV